LVFKLGITHLETVTILGNSENFLFDLNGRLS